MIGISQIRNNSYRPTSWFKAMFFWFMAKKNSIIIIFTLKNQVVG